jgi:alanine transaminase
LQLVSFHSASKGFFGECGRRGGYLELRNFPQDLFDSFLKIPALEMCANISGQWLMEMVMNPPQPGDASYALYKKECDEMQASYLRRARFVVDRLNKIPRIHCNNIDGAFYALASLDLPPSFVATAKAEGKEPDAEWCMQLLEETGLATLPGSGFGQVPGTYHFRTTILPSEELMEEMVKRIAVFQKKFLAKHVGSKL